MSKRQLWFLGIAAFVGVALLALTTGYRVEQYSCAECRNLKRVETRSLLFVDLDPNVEIDDRHAMPNGHMHSWWQYSAYRQRGAGGMLGKVATAKPFRYRDGRSSEALASVGR